VRRLGGCGHGADFGMIFFWRTGNASPENEEISPEKGPFQKERLVFQLSFFRGYLLVFGGVQRMFL